MRMNYLKKHLMNSCDLCGNFRVSTSMVMLNGRDVDRNGRGKRPLQNLRHVQRGAADASHAMMLLSPGCKGDMMIIVCKVWRDIFSSYWWRTRRP